MSDRICEELSQIILAVILYLTVTSLVENGDVVNVAGVVAIALIAFGITKIDEKVESAIAYFLIMTLLIICLGFVWVEFHLKSSPSVLGISFFIGARCMRSRVGRKYDGFLVPNVGSFALITVCYIVIESFKYRSTGNIMIFLSVMYLLLLVYYGNTNGLKRYIWDRKETTVMAGGIMRKMTIRYTVAYVVMLGLVLFLVTRFSYGSVYGILSHVFSGIFSEEGIEKLEEYQQDIILSPMPTMDPSITKKPYQQPQEMGPKALISIIGVLRIIALFLVVILIIFLIVHAISRNGKKQEIEEEVTDTREKLLHPKRRQREEEQNESNANKAIRKLYRKQMKGFWKAPGVTKEDKTPKEQRELKNKSGGHINEEVVELYEKARYSEEELEHDEVRKFKALLK
ncbi:MAG: hypothetical protein Q4G58_03805 [bacterium]|nr:hypothetical protein [bacterium]